MFTQVSALYALWIEAGRLQANGVTVIRLQISLKAVCEYSLLLLPLLSLHRYGLMSRCWMTESSERPKFSEISQQFSEILTENTTIYERTLTSDLGDDYYMQPTDVDDKPIFCSEPDTVKLSAPE